MPFKGTRHGNGVADGAVAKLLPLWQHTSELWRHAVWKRIVTWHNAWMGYEYSLQNMNRPGRFINMIRTPSKQWGVCDKISKLDIMENFLLGNTLIENWLRHKHFINLYARFRHFNRVTLTNRSSETIYRVAYRILWKDNNGWQNYINLHKNLYNVQETHKHTQFVLQRVQMKQEIDETFCKMISSSKRYLCDST